MMSEERDALCDVIQQVYYIRINIPNPSQPKMKFFAVEAKLGQYCTSDSELKKEVDKKPGEEHEAKRVAYKIDAKDST